MKQKMFKLIKIQNLLCEVENSMKNFLKEMWEVYKVQFPDTKAGWLLFIIIYIALLFLLINLNT